MPRLVSSNENRRGREGRRGTCEFQIVPEEDFGLVYKGPKSSPRTSASSAYFAVLVFPHFCINILAAVATMAMAKILRKVGPEISWAQAPPK